MITPSQIFLFVHDGVYCAHTGAGIQNAQYILALRQLYPDAKLFVCPVYTAPHNPDYQAEWHAAVMQSLPANHTTLLPVDNGTSGMERYGSPDIWSKNAAAAASIISNHYDQYNLNLIVSVDTPFIELVPLLRDLPQVRHIHVPASTGKIHDPTNMSRINQETIALANIPINTKIGAIGSYMRHHLQVDYCIPAARLINLYNGRVPAVSEKVHSAEIERFNHMWGVSQGQKLIVAYGRAAAYKGFHTLIQACDVAGRKDWHLLINATTSDDQNAYIADLRSMGAALDLPVTINTVFDARLPIITRQHPQTFATVVPSLHEPFGLIPGEVMLDPYAICTVIVSEVEGLAAQVKHAVTGYTFQPGDYKDLANVLTQCLSASSTNRRAIVKNAHASAAQQYNLLHNMHAALSLLGE